MHVADDYAQDKHSKNDNIEGMKTPPKAFNLAGVASARRRRFALPGMFAAMAMSTVAVMPMANAVTGSGYQGPVMSSITTAATTMFGTASAGTSGNGDVAGGQQSSQPSGSTGSVENAQSEGSSVNFGGEGGDGQASTSVGSSDSTTNGAASGSSSSSSTNTTNMTADGSEDAEEDEIASMFSDVTSDDFADKSTEEKIKLLGKMARADDKLTGIPASLTMAQAIVESGWMESGLTTKYENYFGIKASSSGYNWEGSTWDGRVADMSTGEEYGGSYVTITAGFRVYDNAWDSIRDHSAYLLHNTRNNGAERRYPGIEECEHADEAVDILVDGGYATSSSYKSTLMSVVKKYDLTKYDYTDKDAEQDAEAELSAAAEKAEAALLVAASSNENVDSNSGSK